MHCSQNHVEQMTTPGVLRNIAPLEKEVTAQLQIKDAALGDLTLRLAHLTRAHEDQRVLLDVTTHAYRNLRQRLRELLLSNEDLRAILFAYTCVIEGLRRRRGREGWSSAEEGLLGEFERVLVGLKKSGSGGAKDVDGDSAAVPPAFVIQNSGGGKETVKNQKLKKLAPMADVLVLERSNSSIAVFPKIEEHPFLEVLLTFPLFAGFPLDIMDLVSLSACEIRRKKGQVIIRKGEEGAEIFFLVKGKVSVVVDDKEVTVLRPTTFFGEMGVLFSFKRTATIYAKTDCELVVVTKQKMYDIISENEEVQRQVNDFMTGKEEWWNRQQYIISQEKFGAEFAHTIARDSIRKLDIFKSAPDSLVDTLAMTMKCLVFKNRDYITNIGDDSNSMYFIVDGSVEVVGQNGDVNAEIPSGSFFGEVGALLKIRRTASIRAKQECLVLELVSEVIEEVLKVHPELQQEIQAAVDERLALFQQRTKQASLSNSSEEYIPDQFDMEVGMQSLSKLSIFAGVDKSVVSELAMKMIRKTWDAGECILKHNEIGESMFFLAAGNAEVITEDGAIIDKVCGPSAYFGEVAIIEQVPRTATIKCTSTCSTYELRKDDFKAVMAKFPTIAIEIKKTCEDRLQSYLMRNVLA
ncbi:cyclic nucleotide-binding-like protein [Chytriomyces sp. MP71]|nr:cyclic nucleotide-binding-like protein [Chytriomyces sp. MP71]